MISITISLFQYRHTPYWHGLDKGYSLTSKDVSFPQKAILEMEKAFLKDFERSDPSYD